MSAPPKPRLICLSSGDPLALRDVVAAMRAHFEVQVSHAPEAAAREVRMLAPQVVCFDFGAPSTAELRAMQRLKQSQPSLPVLMLTEAHSEQLAVWSFRVRIWNYLVKPVEPGELDENLRMLAMLVRGGTVRRLPQQLPGARLPRLAPVIRPGERREIVLRAIREIETRFAEPLRAGELARAAGLGASEFSRAFREYCGTSYREFLARERIGQACQLLDQGATEVTQVGYAVGINDPSRFAALFRRIAGRLPSDYVRARRSRRASRRGR